jgi:tetratricopeptide (TPR) repeat protein
MRLGETMSATKELLDQGLKHHQAGRLQEAASVYQQILQANPLNANALHLLGLVQHQQGLHEAGIENIRRAIDVQPRVEIMWENLIEIFLTLGRNRDAADAAKRLLQLNPNNGKGYFNLGRAFWGLGNLESSVTNFRRVLQLNPNSMDAYINLANVLRKLGKLDEAAHGLRHALSLSQGSAQAHFNLGLVLHDQGKIEEAIHSFRKALEINPNYGQAHRDLAVALNSQGKVQEAIGSWRKTLEINPNDAVAHKDLGHNLLRMGNFQEGWAHYEWRWRTQDKIFKPRNFSQPLWDGRPLQGKRLLVHAEQGLGDTLQFIRYLPLVQQRACRVILECQKPLRLLLSRFPGIDKLVLGDDLPPFDFYVPLLSLPYLLGTHAGNIPADVPYLFARQDLIYHWQNRLSDCPGLKIGICWQGSPEHAGDRQRSLSVELFAALADVPSVNLISLQVGIGKEQLAGICFRVKALGPDFDYQTHGSFMDTAAVMKNLDLVVTVDTAVAHLAGALSVPVWVALPKVPDWRWLLGREDSPWYPTMRLFRQSHPGEWADVFQRIAGEARRLVAEKAR